MTNPPKVSVITITYNQENYIREALDSFLIQETDFTYEVIVADDSSSDNTPKIIKEYAEKHPDIFKPIFRKKNIGAQENFKDAILTSKGEYIALCEGDDFWTDPLKLQKEVDFLDTHKSYSLVFHPVRVFFENHEEEDAIFPETTDSKQFTLIKLLEDNYIQTNSVMYRRINYNDLSVKVMPFDWYLHLTHARNGKIGFINEVMSAYRRHNGGIWQEMYENPLVAWKKYGQSYLLLCHELMKLFGKNREYKVIIRKHTARVYEAFAIGALVDKSYDKLAMESLALIPSETWSYVKGLMSDNKELIILDEQHKEQLKEQLKSQEIALQETIHLTQKSAQELHDELTAIKSSKMWRYAMRYRAIKQGLKRLHVR